jgi:hypothetical protein
MIEFRVRHSRSWLDGRYSKMLAYQLADRLVARCQGEKVLKIELTYRREEYSDPADLYDRASEERHVRRFIESLKRYLKTNLTGRWLCKMEFQEGGWVHWHLLILGIDYINHSDLTELWGHGYVWVRRADERELRYVCKYVAKDGQFPAFLYLRPIRSVKIIRVSPGFWKDTPFKKQDDKEGEARHDPEPEHLKLPVYVTVGEIIERGEETIVCRDGRGRYAQVKGDPWGLFRALARMGAKVCGNERGWLQLRGVDLDDVRRLQAHQARIGLGDGLGGRGPRRGEGPDRGGPQAAALNLISSGNPPTGGKIPMRKWMTRVIEWQTGYREMSENQGSSHERIEDYVVLAADVQ